MQWLVHWTRSEATKVLFLLVSELLWSKLPKTAHCCLVILTLLYQALWALDRKMLCNNQVLTYKHQCVCFLSIFFFSPFWAGSMKCSPMPQLAPTWPLWLLITPVNKGRGREGKIPVHRVMWAMGKEWRRATRKNPLVQRPPTYSATKKSLQGINRKIPFSPVYLLFWILTSPWSAHMSCTLFLKTGSPV